MTRHILLIALRRPACALALAAACAAPALAAPSPAEEAAPAAAPPAIRPLAGVLITGTVGKDDGGFTNPDGSTVKGNLSGRYEAYAGAEFPIDTNGLSLRLTAGIHVSGNMSGSSGSEHFTRFPLEATLWYPLNDKLRIGGGARYSMRARFSGAGGHTADGLNATPSLVLGAGYQLLPHLLLDGRYVYERFERYGGADVEASFWGLGLTAIY
ncbi:MAG: outer membrane beta-barrel protein [Burkholderiales bacterium]|nr:outer membrane beta-barrel protein [Burkholderiales bacterium]